MKLNLKTVVGILMVTLQVMAVAGNLLNGFENSIFNLHSVGEAVSILPFFTVGVAGALLFWLGNRKGPGHKL